MINDLLHAVRFFNSEYCNNAGKIIDTVNGTNGPFSYVLGFNAKIYYVMLKKDWFYSFSKIYKGVKAGIGQSFNMKLLESAANDNAMLAVVMADERTYTVPAKEAMQYINEHGTKRIPKKELKEEGSIPASMLQSIQNV